MQRRLIIAGNWKMHGFREQITDLVEGIKRDTVRISHVEIILFPTYVHLVQVQSLLKGSHLFLGAQNLYPGTQGAFTGEVSAPMLVDIGCRYVLIGHSERRSLFHETLAVVAQKFQAAIEFGLIPILCVGETHAERLANQTEAVIERQLSSVIQQTGINVFQKAVIAYEPVWAIGTGLTATPVQAEEVHAFIRTILSKQNVAIAHEMRILYGGSVKPENAAEIFAMPDVDGGLIGGASLNAVSFTAICAAAQVC